MIGTMRHLHILTSLLCLLCLSYLLPIDHTYAQSKAKAPLLDEGLQQLISGMVSLNGKPSPGITDKPVLITFFASWCPPCRPEFAELNQLRDQFPETSLTLIAINAFEGHFADPGEVRMKRFIRQTKPRFPVLAASNEPELLRRFGNLDRIPTVYIYDATGRPRHTFIHQPNATKTHVTAEELLPVLREIVPNPPAN